MKHEKQVNLKVIMIATGGTLGLAEWIIDDTSLVLYKLPISTSAAKQEMIKSKLPNNVLGKIWKLSDVDKDGMLDADEFCLAMHLMNIKLDGHDLPSELPKHLVPPSKRSF